MHINDNEASSRNAADTSNRHVNRQHINMKEDIHDSPQDEEKMKTEVVIIDLPEVSDIPGQEHIVVPNMREMHDTTISSDDEEGVGLFDDDDMDEETDLVMGNEADVTSLEQGILKNADEDMPDEDDPLLRLAGLDTTDDEGAPLNEGSLATDVSGGDLDMSGVDSDDKMEALGEEDEENNDYSLGSESNDNVTEGTP